MRLTNAVIAIWFAAGTVVAQQAADAVAPETAGAGVVATSARVQAAQTAKDFARAPDKAIDYMLQLLPLRRSDKQLIGSLERLLEKQERWDDLVGVWRELLQVQKPKAARATRLRIARGLFERLGRPGDAIAELRALLEDPEVDSAGPLEMLEAVVADTEVEATVRR